MTKSKEKMTTKDIKIQTKTILMTTTLAVLIGTFGFVPATFAHNPPYKDAYWFNYNGDPEVCYLESELDNLTVNGSTGNGADVESEVEDTRAHFNSQISGLTIAAEDESCTYNRIEVGAKSLSWGVMAQAQLTAYYPTPNFGQYAEQEVDFATGFNWEVESNACDFWNDKDLEWLANHEFGHALSLDHHSGDDHSMMKDGCTTKYSVIQSVDDSALEARY